MLLSGKQVDLVGIEVDPLVGEHQTDLLRAGRQGGVVERGWIWTSFGPVITLLHPRSPIRDGPRPSYPVEEDRLLGSPG